MLVLFVIFLFASHLAAAPSQVANSSSTNEGTPSASLTEGADNLFESISQRVEANQKNFFVYKDGDSGFNHGFASGFFGSFQKISVDAFCVNDPEAENGCSQDPERIDRERGNVFRLTFAPLDEEQFAGVNFEEPEKHASGHEGMGYDLRPAERVVFDIRSPQRIRVQFGVGGSVTPFMDIPASEEFSQVVIPFDSLDPPLNDRQDVHILFAVATNFEHAPNGGTILLDNIRIEPVPAQHLGMPSFPLGTETFGIVPVEDVLAGRVAIPPDQVSRNLTTTYESSLALLAFLDRKNPRDLELARFLAESFHHARDHDNSGASLPVAPDGSPELRNGYSSGDLALFNDQGPDGGRKGEVRLAGFTAPVLCPQTGFCLVLDRATGGNVAFAILSLLAAYRQFEGQS